MLSDRGRRGSALDLSLMATEFFYGSPVLSRVSLGLQTSQELTPERGVEISFRAAVPYSPSGRATNSFRLAIYPRARRCFFSEKRPVATVLALTSVEAEALFTYTSRRNPKLVSIWPDLLPNRLSPVFDIDLLSGFEGEESLVVHLRRERNRGLIEAKKNEVLSRTKDLRCEICAFSFYDRYGARGEAFCEVHTGHLWRMAVRGRRRWTTSLSFVQTVIGCCTANLGLRFRDCRRN